MKKNINYHKNFWEQVARPDRQTNCWVWTASKNKSGYGRFNYRGHIYAHRFSWIVHFGKIPKGMLVCHKCDNPTCVNPKHLFLGTHSDNIKDCVKKGRHKETKKTHCINGHAFNRKNTKLYRGKRWCKLCMNHNARRYRLEKSS